MGILNNFSRLCGIVAVPSCLVPGPGIIEGGVGECGLWNGWFAHEKHTKRGTLLSAGIGWFWEVQLPHDQ